MIRQSNIPFFIILSIGRVADRLSILLGVGILLASCASTPVVKNPNNICKIFKQNPSWYWTSQDVKKRYGVPISVQMAVMKQESHFQSKALPPRTKLLWVIPWKRPSSAYGYCQAKNEVWGEFKTQTGRRRARRDKFTDAVYFIGWYGNKASRKLHIPRSDAYKLYLAYHEGIGGYKRKTYLKKQWLIQIAHNVKRNQLRYYEQLTRCQKSLPGKPWYRIFLA